MFKFFALCLFAIVALAAAKPQFLTSYTAAPVLAASPYAAYTSGVYAASPYAAYSTYAAPYAAAYSAYPYSSLYLRR
ncbi:uncharacterized protein LOC115632974 [Scaptodrosophila lebanonensis]|uniref:Uncharacterized protein LOC115632974 n=1 Tax=Drosophila lebanonensis TaxID=7225 RepID=A0A6J2UCN8_DROLE|nr:uncharacterized protein LOC115632974 [Scaptodrosophila lebanonensis]